ncbi:hypothetical protein [Brevibacillus reuszeri]|uniref:hypothetical protein n=1 Tax=Brevibacillus reuszeri TaxID=54915 RepID=UPI001FD08053|nr:hypothetical protein [Brevibacillus reuszeri]
MNTLLYLILGFLDIIVVIAFIFKLFRFPFWDYKREVIIIGLSLAITSFLVRIIFEIPEIDLAIQFFLFIVFFRYLIKFRVAEAAMLTAIGILAFDLSQLLVIPSLITLEVASLGDVFRSTGMGTFLIQAVNDGVMILVSWILFRFNLGFSFIMQPPHEVRWKTSYKGTNFVALIGVLIASVAIFATLYILLNYFNEIKYVAITVIVAFIILLITSHKKEMEDLEGYD